MAAVRERVYAVHSVKPDELGAVEVVYPTVDQALAYAADRSRDERVLSTSVTEYTMGSLGSRRPVTWFVEGVEQPPKFDRSRIYPAG
ncbi:hypothetical protein [Pseudonocardia sp. WMMC193]|uniref:hypothetical protein n=1 Tax=Pseudonocardia sp. WMMC193 TaxID=2911965 RepID=UPI001F330907|nr:hypothetical protein [Pseudonocardia sp. WMMC193]MCF7552581.1 hypothetical protein [Pseudonocardia sp. WMMC193]